MSTAAAGPSTTCPAAPAASDGWLEALLEHAERIVTGAYARERFDGAPREEAFVGVAPRTRRRGSKDAVAATRFLWVDVDRPGQLPALWAFLAERPCHLLIESGGSGGVHAYWKLAAPPARGVSGVDEPIERANARIIHALGIDADGRPTVADPQCRERARVMRLAGTVNYKTGAYARVVEADLQLPSYRLEELIGDLAGPRAAAGRAAAHDWRRARTRTSGSRRRSTSSDWQGSACRAAVSCAARRHGMTTRTRPAASASTRSRAGAATARAAGRAARSTTSRACCSAGRGAASCAARRSSAPAGPRHRRLRASRRDELGVGRGGGRGIDQRCDSPATRAART